MDQNALHTKKQSLLTHLRSLGSVVIAFSGGVDSTLLLAMAYEALGDRVLAATARSVIHPRSEMERASRFTQEKGIRHIIFHSEEMADADFLQNTSNRCYYCKRLIMLCLNRIAQAEGIEHVAHGANVDDLSDFRPGYKAAQEYGAIAPLVEAQMTKADIRQLSKAMGLPTWDQPSMACLASRVPYGSPITVEKLRMIEEAENFLLDQGVDHVRVRHHGTLATIETGPHGEKILLTETVRKDLIKRLREIGFSHIALDLEGYVSGKMNRDL